MTAADQCGPVEHRRSEPPEKRVGWIELFFDLVFVFAVTQVSAVFLQDHGWLGCVRALVVFVPLYWAWVGTTMQANVNDMTSVGRRVTILAIALAGLLIALAVPYAFGERGLLIALGESVVAIGLPAAGAEHLDAAVLSAGALAFVVVCGLWWLYFAYASDAMRHALATAQVQLDVARHVLSYGHLVFLAAVICIAVGLEEVVTEPTHHLSGPVVGLLLGGCAVYCATFGYTRWEMFRTVSTTRLTAAAVIVALSGVAPHVPALAALGGLGLVLAALNTVEYRRVQRPSS